MFKIQFLTHVLPKPNGGCGIRRIAVPPFPSRRGRSIEVKYAYKKEDFKKRIEKEIMQDSVGYLTNTQQYKKIIVFIYDNSRSVQEHSITRRDLMKVSGIEDVIIVSKPSQLP